MPPNQIDLNLTSEDFPSYLTPSKEEQTLLMLKGRCPHNKGWIYDGYSHNDDVYKCRLCGELRFH